jgi:hypothetical protein
MSYLLKKKSVASELYKKDKMSWLWKVLVKKLKKFWKKNSWILECVVSAAPEVKTQHLFSLDYFIDQFYSFKSLSLYSKISILLSFQQHYLLSFFKIHLKTGIVLGILYPKKIKNKIKTTISFFASTLHYHHPHHIGPDCQLNKII